MAFKKGQKLRVVRAEDTLGLTNGEIVEVSQDTVANGAFVHIVGKPSNPYFSSRFEALPAEPFKPKFLKGQKVRVTSATGTSFSEGAITTTTGDSFLGFDGKEVVQVFRGPFSVPLYVSRLEDAEAFKAGQRVWVKNTPGYAAQEPATAIVESFRPARDGEVPKLVVKWERNGHDRGQMDGAYNASMFSAEPKPVLVPTFVPKFKKGDQLKVVTQNVGNESVGQIETGETVTAAADSHSSYNGKERVRVLKLGRELGFEYHVAHFALVEKGFEPSIKKGQWLVVVDDSGTDSVSEGDVVVASSDSFKTSKGNEAVRIEGQPQYKQYLVSRFKPSPAAPAFVPKFKAGQKLKVAGFTMSFKNGESVVAAADSFLLGEAGEEHVKIVGRLYSYRVGIFEPDTDTAPVMAHPQTVYFVEDEAGDTFLTDDLSDIDNNSKVAVFEFKRLGVAKAPKRAEASIE